jgi:hypothetical protein
MVEKKCKALILADPVDIFPHTGCLLSWEQGAGWRNAMQFAGIYLPEELFDVANCNHPPPLLSTYF